MYINIMVPENTDIFGLDREDDKIKGIAEFSFNDREGLTLPSLIADMIPKKKKEPVIIEKNDRRNKRKSRDNSLF